MSSRSLGVVSLERFLAVERYRETHQAPSTHPYRTAESGGRDDQVTRGAAALQRHFGQGPMSLLLGPLPAPLRWAGNRLATGRRLVVLASDPTARPLEDVGSLVWPRGCRVV